MKSNDQYITELLHDKITKFKTKGNDTSNSLTLLLLAIIFLLAIFLIQNMFKINRLNLELQSVSSKQDAMLMILNRVSRNIETLPKENESPEFYNFKIRNLQQNLSIKYQATINGDQLYSINNNESFYGKVKIITQANSEYSGIISQTDNSLSIYIRDKIKHQILYVNLDNGFLTKATEVAYISKYRQGAKETTTIQIKDLIVYYID